MNLIDIENINYNNENQINKCLNLKIIEKKLNFFAD